MNTHSVGWLAIAVALSLLSCGDATPPPGEGAVSISISPSGLSPANHGCSISQTVLLGNAAPGPASQGGTWVDGEGGHAVSCSVSGDGTFSVSGEISADRAYFRINGTVQAGGTGTAKVSMFVASTGDSLYDATCTISATGDYKVEKGAIWAGVTCSNLKSSDLFQWCAATGTFVFKSCAS
jgi:hypothetical protein